MTVAPVIDKSNTAEQNIKRLTPTSLIQFVSETTLDIITPILDRIFVKQNTEFPDFEMEIPSVIETRKGYFEEISDINGNAIPILFYDYLLNEKMANPLRRIILQEIKNFKPNEHLFLKQIVENMPKTCEKISDYLYLANISTAVQEKFYSKLNQIDPEEYDWLSETAISLCFERMNIVLGEECTNGKWTPEKNIIYDSADEDHFEIDQCLKQHLGPEYTYRFSARIDMVTENTIWEWKCTSQTTIEHRMQLVIYAWLWKMVYESDKSYIGKEKTFKLFNIKTGELWELNATREELTTIVVELLRGKYTNPHKKTDEEYITEAISYLSV
jgi:hypothetical protein